MIHQTLMLVWTQAWQIAVLFFVILILFRLFARNRPRVAHLLWALILIKCLIPPVVSSSWAPFSWMSHSVQQWLPTETVAPRSNIDLITYSTQGTSSFRPKPTGEASYNEHSKDQPKIGDSRLVYRSQAERMLFAFWIASIAFVIAAWASRFAHVLYRLRLHRIETPARVTKIADDLVHLLDHRRCVRVHVSNERIGPAVIGWLRPQILLPAFLVERMDDRALQILIAHELTHIRRGDLLWAFLQTVAGSLWWFHPAVWIANRQLNLECERSCDEETIARLKCPASDYAKCLLQVLEWKHQLYPVPAAPGVRPMQVTKNRLERIMKMRHGSTRKNPRMLFLAMVMAVLVVAPGAEVGNGQQSTQTPKTAHTEPTAPISTAFAGSVKSDLGLVGEVVMATTPKSSEATRSTKVYDVSDLLERFAADEAIDGEAANKRLESMLACYETRTAPSTKTTELAAVPSPSPALPHASAQLDGEFSLVNGQFTATTSETNHQRISNQLTRYREFGFKTLHCSVDIFCGPDELSLEGLTWENTEMESSRLSMGILDRSQANSITKFVSQQKRISRLMAPRFVIANGSTGSAMVGTSVSVNPSGTRPSDANANADRLEGVRVDVRAVIRPEDLTWVEFRLTDSHSEGEPIPPTMLKKLRTHFIDTAVELSIDKVVAIRLQVPELESPQKGKCYFALVQAEPLDPNGANRRPNDASAAEGSRESNDSITNKVIAIPRFDFE